MKTITEAEAQQLANLLWMWIAVDDSDRPWTEQIWGPESNLIIEMPMDY